MGDLADGEPLEPDGGPARESEQPDARTQENRRDADQDLVEGYAIVSNDPDVTKE